MLDEYLGPYLVMAS